MGTIPSFRSDDFATNSKANNADQYFAIEISSVNYITWQSLHESKPLTDLLERFDARVHDVAQMCHTAEHVDTLLYNDPGDGGVFYTHPLGLLPEVEPGPCSLTLQLSLHNLKPLNGCR